MLLHQLSCLCLLCVLYLRLMCDFHHVSVPVALHQLCPWLEQQFFFVFVQMVFQPLSVMHLKFQF